MKSLLLSIKPKWVAKIFNGDKTIEVRKVFPKEYKGWVYIYCTKDNDYPLFAIYRNDRIVKYRYDEKHWHKGMWEEDRLNGKVVARFYCDKVERFEREYLSRDIDDYYQDNGCALDKKFYKQSCLNEKELFDYIGGGSGYAIHISQLEIFDEPKDISEFYHYVKPKRTKDDIEFEKKMGCQTFYVSKLKPLTKAPQNYCYVEVE